MADFTGDLTLLVSMNNFQDYLVDKSSGLPLAAGIVTLYQDENRTILKNWYYQKSSGGSYSFAALNNPMTLSSVGTVTDPNGNDVLPFFYPYNESATGGTIEKQAYYVTVDNSIGTRQFTRENFPYIATGSSATGISSYNNLIVNSQFYGNASGGAGAVTVGTDTIIAPSQHQGFSKPEIRFQKSTNDGTDTITFTKFSADESQLTDDVTPEYYINYNCSNFGTSTTKQIWIPLQLHLAALSNQNGVFTIQTRSTSPSAAVTVKVTLYADVGTGGTQAAQTSIQTITPTTAWTKTPVSLAFPNVNDITGISNAGDDAYYIVLDFPKDQTFTVDIAMPQAYMATEAPVNFIENYDQIAAVIYAPRTGDVKQCLTTYGFNGWVTCDDGTIGNSSSNATARGNADTWPLFNVLWQLFNVYTHSTTNDVCQMYTSASAPVAYGASAYADFNANRQLSLPKFENRTIVGTPLITPSVNYSASDDGSGNLLITVASTANYYRGQPVGFKTSATTPPPLSIHEIAYISTIVNGTTMYVSSTYANALASTYIAYGGAGTGTQTILNDVPGTILGETGHTQLNGELPQDAPLYNDAVQVYRDNTGAGTGFLVTPDSSNITGSHPYHVGPHTPTAQQAINIMQPSIYMMTFMKL